VLGVRLRPGAVTAFGGVQAGELLDAVLPFSLGMSAEQLVAARLASGSRCEQDSFQVQLRLVLEALRAHVDALDEPDPVVRHALGRWVRAELPDFPSVSILTRDVGLSERAFERRFIANVGLTPVSYRRLARLRTVFRLQRVPVDGHRSLPLPASAIRPTWSVTAALSRASRPPHGLPRKPLPPDFFKMGQ
jgi:AraC-like DNA-binding protein